MGYNHDKKLNEKVEQLKKVKNGEITSRKLREQINKRRVAWIKEHLDEMEEKYKHLPLDEMAHKIIFIEHLNINPEDSRITRVGPNKIRIDSHNQCPYLDACKKLGMDTRRVCKFIGEEGFNKMIKIIHPNLKFSRNYDNIRPNNPHYCEEYIEFLNPEQ